MESSAAAEPPPPRLSETPGSNHAPSTTPSGPPPTGYDRASSTSKPATPVPHPAAIAPRVKEQPPHSHNGFAAINGNLPFQRTPPIPEPGSLEARLRLIEEKCDYNKSELERQYSWRSRSERIMEEMNRIGEHLERLDIGFQRYAEDYNRDRSDIWMAIQNLRGHMDYLVNTKTDSDRPRTQSDLGNLERVMENFGRLERKQHEMDGRLLEADNLSRNLDLLKERLRRLEAGQPPLAGSTPNLVSPDRPHHRPELHAPSTASHPPASQDHRAVPEHRRVPSTAGDPRAEYARPPPPPPHTLPGPHPPQPFRPSEPPTIRVPPEGPQPASSSWATVNHHSPKRPPPGYDEREDASKRARVDPAAPPSREMDPSRRYSGSHPPLPPNESAARPASSHASLHIIPYGPREGEPPAAWGRDGHHGAPGASPRGRPPGRGRGRPKAEHDGQMHDWRAVPPPPPSAGSDARYPSSQQHPPPPQQPQQPHHQQQPPPPPQHPHSHPPPPPHHIVMPMQQRGGDPRRSGPGMAPILMPGAPHPPSQPPQHPLGGPVGREIIVDPRGHPPPMGSHESSSPTSGAYNKVLIDPYAHTKKSRTKPVRNADGVLIRKDGRPDMRSHSSAANLRKVHARKEAERRSEGGTGHADSVAGDASGLPGSSPPDSAFSDDGGSKTHDHDHDHDDSEGDYESRNGSRDVSMVHHSPSIPQQQQTSTAGPDAERQAPSAASPKQQAAAPPAQPPREGEASESRRTAENVADKDVTMSNAADFRVMGTTAPAPAGPTTTATAAPAVRSPSASSTTAPAANAQAVPTPYRHDSHSSTPEHHPGELKSGHSHHSHGHGHHHDVRSDTNTGPAPVATMQVERARGEVAAN